MHRSSSLAFAATTDSRLDIMRRGKRSEGAGATMWGVISQESARGTQVLPCSHGSGQVRPRGSHAPRLTCQPGAMSPRVRPAFVYAISHACCQNGTDLIRMDWVRWIYPARVTALEYTQPESDHAPPTGHGGGWARLGDRGPRSGVPDGREMGERRPPHGTVGMLQSMHGCPPVAVHARARGSLVGTFTAAGRPGLGESKGERPCAFLCVGEDRG